MPRTGAKSHGTPCATSSPVLPKTARISHGNQVTDVRVTQLDSTKVEFVGLPTMAAVFARMTFKLRDQWFDVEGVVVSRSIGAGACMCQLIFSAMAATEQARLERAQRDRAPRPAALGFPRPREVARQAAAVPTPQTPTPAPANEVQQLFRDALKDLAM